jgi:hypothetical protein
MKTDTRIDARNEKLKSAYQAATAASHTAVSVWLEVSQDVWDYLMSIREIDTTKAEAPGVFRGLEWLTAIPIRLQRQWEPDFRVDVCTRKIIL